MAEGGDDSEKTEDPSQKKLNEAHERGDVAKSQEVSSWFSLLTATIILAFIIGPSAVQISDYLKRFIEQPHLIGTDFEGVRDIMASTLNALMLPVLFPMALLVIAGIVANLAQNGLIFTTKTIEPKLSKISPVSGFKRLFSMESLVNFLKGLFKIVVVSVVMFVVLWPERDRLDELVTSGLADLMPIILWLAIKVMIGVLAVLTLITIVDLIYQRNKWYEKQKMTHKEVKDEYKQTEGDPAVKARIRRVRAERTRQRMMAAVPEATVVITNPTHYSVALKYDEEMQAPVCLAKGVDNIALKIREVAKEHDIPIVENPPLARALYASVDLDEMIPAEHFRAVAKVIGFVYQQQANRAARRSGL